MKREDFTKFFAAVNGGHTPFSWQERLLDTLLENGRWPDRIAAPTGAGKTAAIDIHVFVTAFTASGDGPRLPRRLAMVVDRRVLVDDQYQRARALAAALADPHHGLVAEVADLLAGLHTVDREASAGVPPLVTARLRGGSVPSRSWRDHPTACAVLCATPDMWGSRLLFGGYGTSSSAASREAGLLAFDCAVLVDEAHLARQLLVTARRVSDLVQVAEQPVAMVPALQVVGVSATPDGEATTSVAVEDSDLTEEGLRARLTSPKPVTLLSVPDWPRPTAKAAADIARAVTAMRANPGAVTETPGADGVATIGCYVNTVPMALAVADALRRESLHVVTICGQVRPADLGRLTRRYPGVLTTRGNSDVDVIVSTQSLEVGADLDLAGIVTELASGSALAQRVGRANRRGTRPTAPVTVIVPDGELTEKMRSGPYLQDELRAALDWVTERAAGPLGLAPWAVREAAPPAALRRRQLYQRPELADAWHWARTSDDLAVDSEFELWLSDSLEAETSVGIVVRDAVPEDPAEAVEFVRDLQPQRWEVFPVPYRTAQAVLVELITAGKAAVRVRGGDVEMLRLRSEDQPDIRPGDTAVVDSSIEIVTRAADYGFSPPVVVASASSSPDTEESVDAVRRSRGEDVLHFQPEPRAGGLVLRLEWSPGYAQVAGFPQEAARRLLGDFIENFDEKAGRAARDSLAALLKGLPDDEWPAELRPAKAEIIKLLRGNVKNSDVVVRRFEEGGVRVVVLDSRRAVADEDIRQVFSLREHEPVKLADHQRDVGERAQAVASALALPAELESVLRLAGEHHDDGKADQRFQVSRLGASGEGEPWAKSEPSRTVREVLEHELGGLPARWRHEQRSVVDGWAAVQATAGIDPELALRLIGTSHGHGRTDFPHSASELANSDDSADWRELAAGLFDAGGWDQLIESTQARYGVWGCAYLEALLRAADCQVSGENK